MFKFLGKVKFNLIDLIACSIMVIYFINDEAFIGIMVGVALAIVSVIVSYEHKIVEIRNDSLYKQKVNELQDAKYQLDQLIHANAELFKALENKAIALDALFNGYREETNTQGKSQ